MSEQNIFSLANVERLLDPRIKKGITRGAPTGFRSLNRKWSLKKGYTTSIFAAAGQGKSILALEIAMNLAEFEGWTWCIYTPETGTVVDVYIELLWMYNGIKVESQTKKQLQKAKDFIGKHFFVIDFDANDMIRESKAKGEKGKLDFSEKGIKDPSVNDIYKQAYDLEEKSGITLDGILIDPFTELSLPNENGLREDLNYGVHLSRCIRHSKRRNIHSIITFHTSKQNMKTWNGISYTDIPHPSEIVNGMMTHRKSYMMLSTWIPPVGMPNPQNDNKPFEPFETILTISKVKPKLIGAKGQISLFYDQDRNRYYEKENNGSRTYASKDANVPTEASEEEVDINQIDLEHSISAAEFNSVKIDPCDTDVAF